MSLPVLDKDSHQSSFSDWVMYAGQALQQAGYLQAEPTGLYDEDFAAGLEAFQAAHGINEENQVGPYTWAALGVPEPDSAESEGQAAEQSVQVGELSEDGQWRWDGIEWKPADHAPADHAPADHAPADQAPAEHAEGAPDAGDPESAVEVTFNDDIDGPDTEEAIAPDLGDIDDIDALWRAEPSTAEAETGGR